MLLACEDKLLLLLLLLFATFLTQLWEFKPISSSKYWVVQRHTGCQWAFLKTYLNITHNLYALWQSGQAEATRAENRVPRCLSLCLKAQVGGALHSWLSLTHLEWLCILGHLSYLGSFSPVCSILGRILVVANIFQLRVMEATTFLAFTRSASELCRQFLWPHGFWFLRHQSVHYQLWGLL